jgi:hypothetical protein
MLQSIPGSHALRGNASLGRSASPPSDSRGAAKTCVPTRSVGTRTVMAIALLLTATHPVFAAGPRVDIVIGEKAPPLERRAAEDVAADLKKVYEADVKIATAAPEGAENVIFIGSPKTNEQTAKQISEKWPKLTEQGHVVRTIEYGGKPALFLGGGSPKAAYWAASEYAHSLGVRSLLFGDLYPVAPKPFTLEGYEVFVLPAKENRAWRTSDPLPTGFSSWGLRDQRPMLRQLARLKYTQLDLDVRAWQPFDDFEFAGVKKETGVLWYGWRIEVSGDTAGRGAFKGAKVFENPDFSGAATYEERLKAGQQWMRGLIDEAHLLGLEVHLHVDPHRVPKEFASLISGSQPVLEPGELEISIRQSASGGKSGQLAKARLDAYKKAFPKVDQVHAALMNSELAPTELVADRNHWAYAHSRLLVNPMLDLKAVGRDLVVPICGDGVEESVLKAHDQMAAAMDLLDDGDHRFTVMVPDVIMKHYHQSDPPPQWWSQVRDNYLGAMNDMYRANTRGRAGGRSYTLYLARRCEFGYEYMNCVEATRKAGIAKSKKDTAEQRAQLEKAVESMNAACAALAAVARDPSDRGMIAVCNEFGYRPLQRELEKLDAEESK